MKEKREERRERSRDLLVYRAGKRGSDGLTLMLQFVSRSCTFYIQVGKLLSTRDCEYQSGLPPLLRDEIEIS